MRKSLLRDFAFFLTCFLSARGLMLAALGTLVGGREFSDDLIYLRELVDDPWMILMGRGGALAKYAPFEAFAILPLFRPLSRLVPEFYAWRLTLLAWEGLMGCLFVVLLRRTIESATLRRRLMLAFVICPTCWMCSLVIPQDEVLVGCFLTLALTLVALGRPWAALLAGGFGVVITKIYLILALGAMIWLLPVGTLAVRGLAGGGFVLLVYFWMILISRLRGVPPPLVGYAPDPVFGVNIWVWIFQRFKPSAIAVQRGSSLLALVAAAIPVLTASWRQYRPAAGPGMTALGLSRVIAVMYLWFFVVFVQVNPEYYVLCVTALLLLFTGWWDLAFLMTALALPWVTNYLYGIHTAGIIGIEGREGKATWIDLYHRLVPIPVERSYWPVYWTTVLALVALAVLGTLRWLRLGRSSSSEACSSLPVDSSTAAVTSRPTA